MKELVVTIVIILFLSSCGVMVDSFRKLNWRYPNPWDYVFLVDYETNGLYVVELECFCWDGPHLYVQFTYFDEEMGLMVKKQKILKNAKGRYDVKKLHKSQYKFTDEYKKAKQAGKRNSKGRNGLFKDEIRQ